MSTFRKEFLEHTSSDNTRKIRVLKFGGTSVGTPKSITDVVDVVLRTTRERRVVVVVSALASVTDRLEKIIDNGADEALKHLISLYSLHLETARSLLPRPILKSYRATLGKEFASVVPPIRRILQNVASLFDAETVLAAGERFSAPLVSAALRHAGLISSHVDASRLIRVRDIGSRQVDTSKTSQRIRTWYAQVSDNSIPVVTGFIGSSSCGRTVTLGRGGSDFSAALIASSLSAEVLERWTNVDGLYTDDPGRCPDAKKIDRLSLEHAAALNKSEQLGMHRHTLEPLI